MDNCSNIQLLILYTEPYVPHFKVPSSNCCQNSRLSVSTCLNTYLRLHRAVNKIAQLYSVCGIICEKDWVFLICFADWFYKFRFLFHISWYSYYLIIQVKRKKIAIFGSPEKLETLHYLNHVLFILFIYKNYIYFFYLSTGRIGKDEMSRVSKEMNQTSSG